MTSEMSESSSMTCAEIDARLEEYVAGDLTPAEESRVATHLMACRRCAAAAALGERVAFELSVLPAFDAPPALLARIKAAARPATAPAAWQPRRRLLPVALAASLIAAVALGWWQRARFAPAVIETPRAAAVATEPTPAEIAAAEREARYALAVVARLGRRAGEEIRREVLIERLAVPLVEGLSGRSGVKSGGVES